MISYDNKYRYVTTKLWSALRWDKNSGFLAPSLSASLKIFICWIKWKLKILLGNLVKLFRPQTLIYLKYHCNQCNLNVYRWHEIFPVSLLTHYFRISAYSQFFKIYFSSKFIIIVSKSTFKLQQNQHPMHCISREICRQMYSQNNFPRFFFF